MVYAGITRRFLDVPAPLTVCVDTGAVPVFNDEKSTVESSSLLRDLKLKIRSQRPDDPGVVL